MLLKTDKAMYYVTASQCLDLHMQRLRAAIAGVEFDEDAWWAKVREG